MIIDEEQYIAHYGIRRRSGRYPWGTSGWGEGSDNPDYPWSGAATTIERSRGFYSYIEEMKAKGLTESQIAKGVGISVADLRSVKTLAKEEIKASNIAQARRLRDKGTSTKEIAERLEVSESSVRAYLQPGIDDSKDQLESIISRLKENVDNKTYLDVGLGVETQMGVSKEKLNTAIVALKDEGYVLSTVPVTQLLTGNNTTVTVLSPPKTTQRDVFLNRLEIQQITDYSDDGGRTWYGIMPPLSVDKKRVAVKWDEDGGSKEDGLMYLRPGVEDLSMGGKPYGQVRILVNDTHYLKGMALYKDDLPKGVDILFNTNKPKSGNVLDALKPIEEDKDNPFGALIKRQIIEKDKDGNDKLTSAINLVEQEGSWLKWRDSVSSQMLSKQDPGVIKEQLDKFYKKNSDELESIEKLTNPLVRKKLLESYANEIELKTNRLEAATFPRQAWQVIIPITSLKDNEVFAPNYNNGERVALIRFPHGGTFEIPDLIVNNKNREANKVLGGTARDAIGINHKVAARLSGADFDGDPVLLIPNGDGKIKSSPALEGLKNFDPVKEYPSFPGMKPMDKVTKQKQMGVVSNLITDMTIRGASTEKIVRAVKHSMVVIDAEKHKLNWKESERVNGIAALKAEFQQRANGSGGASTLLSRASAEVRIPEQKLRLHKDGGPIDKKTGKQVFVPTGRTYVDKQGETQLSTQKVRRLSLYDDAFDLVEGTGTRVERLYASHSNRMKALENKARLEASNIKPPRVNTSALTKAAYAPEIRSLDSKLALIKANRPAERQANIIANSVYRAKIQANPNLDKKDRIKIKIQATEEARIRVDAQSKKVSITQNEWDAIQSGVISSNKVSQILNKADMKEIKEYATPRSHLLMSDSKTSRAKQMMKNGFTRAQVAQALGVSLSTLDKALYTEE